MLCGKAFADKRGMRGGENRPAAIIASRAAIGLRLPRKPFDNSRWRTSRQEASVCP
jgi:hypothetical protein